MPTNDPLVILLEPLLVQLADMRAKARAARKTDVDVDGDAGAPETGALPSAAVQPASEDRAPSSPKS